MSMQAAMGLTNRLLAHAQALAAVTAYLGDATGDAPVDPALRAQIERVVDVLGEREALDALSDRERAVVMAFARSYLHQAVELADDPGRANAWSHRDPTILQAQGAASAVVATLIHGAGLAGGGQRILDVGTGVARLAMAFCEADPAATVVGIDPWEPALSLARANVAEAGLQDRIALHGVTIQDFDDPEGFDLIWLPSFFIPDGALDDAFRRARAMLRPGGALVVGTFDYSESSLATAVDAMITIRSGGAALAPDEAIARLGAAGFGEAREAERTWQAPLRLVVGRGE